MPPDEDFETKLEEEKCHGQDLLRRAVEGQARSGIDATQDLLNGDAATEIIKYARKRKWIGSWPGHGVWALSRPSF